MAHYREPSPSDALDKALDRYDFLVRSYYIFNLSSYPLSLITTQSCPIKLLQIKVFPQTPAYTNLSFVISALGSINTVIGYIIESSPNGLTIYAGVQSEVSSETSYLLLKNGLINTFPGMIIEEPSPERTMHLLEHWFNPNRYTFICAATVIPSESYQPPLLNSFSTLMGKTEPYVAFLLATPVLRQQLEDYLNELIKLYNTFSSYTNFSHNILNGKNHSDSKTFSDSDAVTHSHSSTKTDTTNASCSFSNYTNVTPSTSIPITDKQSLGISVLKNEAVGHTKGSSLACADCNIHTNTTTHGTTLHYTKGKSTTHTIGYSSQNKYIMDIQENLNTLIKRIRTILNRGPLQFGAYFISSYAETCLRAAYTYQGLALGTSQPISPSAVNSWSNTSPDFAPILEELKQFHQPSFEVSCQHRCVTLTSMIQSLELVNTLYFPSSTDT